MYGQHLEPPKGSATDNPATGASGDDTDAGDQRLYPISSVISFDDLAIYRIGGGTLVL